MPGRVLALLAAALLAAASMLAYNAAQPHPVLAADPLEVSFTADSRHYDGTTDATILTARWSPT